MSNTTAPAGPAKRQTPSPADNINTLAYKLGYDHALHFVPECDGLEMLAEHVHMLYSNGHSAGMAALRAALPGRRG